jgi:hypothetical protein
MARPLRKPTCNKTCCLIQSTISEDRGDDRAGLMADLIIRPRVERLLYGDFTLDDLTRIFLFLRERSYGRKTVREIGDFVAHLGERDRGVTTDLARDFFKVLRFMIPLMNQSNPQITLEPEVLIATFATIGMEQIRIETKMKPKVAKRVFQSLLEKAKGVLGVDKSVTLTGQESALARLLVSRFTVTSAFDDKRLNKEFCECLEKAKLLHSNERGLLKTKEPLIALFALYCMHQSTLKLEDGSQAYLELNYHNSERLLTVVASSPCPTKETPTLALGLRA